MRLRLLTYQGTDQVSKYIRIMGANFYRQRRESQTLKRRKLGWTLWRWLILEVIIVNSWFFNIDRQTIDKYSAGVYVCLCKRKYKRTQGHTRSLTLFTKGTHEQWQPHSNEHPCPRSWFLTITPLPRRNQGSLEQWLVSGSGKGKCKMSMENLTVPESKEVLKNDASCPKDTGASFK